MFRHFSVLYFEDLGIHIVQDREKDLDVKTYITLSLLSIECTILLICIYQLWRFFQHEARLRLKKLIHSLIALQMIVCLLQAVHIPDIYEEFLGETAFVFCSLIYFSVLLFWYDFHQKLKLGKGIEFIKQNPFVICIIVYILFYMGAFGTAQYLLNYYKKDFNLPAVAVWWHLALFTFLVVGIIYVTVLIFATTRRLYVSVRIRFFRRTAQILVVVCCCFFVRFLGTLLFIFLHHKPEYVMKGWDTPTGFAIIYMFDRIIPVVVFMVLMRKVPSAPREPLQTGGSSGSFGSLYAPLLSDEA